MNAYATIDEIRAASPNVPPIVHGSDGDISRWALEATVTINNHCRTNFTFEQQGVRSVPIAVYADVYLPQPISGETVFRKSATGQDPSFVSANYFEVTPGAQMIRYTGFSPNGSPSTLSVTADWGFAPSQTYLIIVAANDFKTRYEQHRVSTAAHLVPDTTNVILVPDATDLASAITLLNDVKTQLDAHMQDDTAHKQGTVLLTPAPNATDEASATKLAIALKATFNAHVRSTIRHVVVEPFATYLSVTNPILPAEIKLAFMRVVARVAIRDNPEDLRYQNSGFDSESFSDGYSYRVSEARAYLITASEMALLHEYVNEGRVAY